MANYTSQYTFGVSADTKSAQSSLNALTKSLRDIQSKKFKFNVDDSRLKEASEAARLLQHELQNAMNVDTGKLDLTKLITSLNSAGTSIGQLSTKLLNAGTEGQRAFSQLTSAIASAEAPVKRLSSAFSTMGTTLMNTIKWQASSSLIHGLMSSVSGAISYVKNLNGTLNDIRVVTGASSDEMARFAVEANRAAKQLSTSTNEFAKASLIYYQQGDSAELAAKKAAITTKAANVAFTASAQEMSEMLTAVWNSYQAGEDQLEHMVDVLAKLGATTASSMEEMATGMQKVAATANTVGVSMEQMSAIVATSASVTRQAPQTIGTAWNTILSRIGGLKLGETLEDGVDLNKYSKALQTVGVDVLDATGELRNMGDVIDELGAKWDTLSTAQQSALAQTIGGARQYTQILAFFENFDKYQQNMQTANNADGALQEQADIYAESWEAASKRVQAAMETLYNQLINDKAITKLTSVIANVISGITTITQSMGGAVNVLTLIGTTIASSHLDAFATKLQEIGTDIKTLFSGNTEINAYAESIQSLQNQMVSIMDQDLSANTEVELRYDIQILEIKKQIAEKQGKITQAQKESAEASIRQLENDKKYYQQLLSLQNQNQEQQTKTARAASAQAITNTMGSELFGNDYKNNKSLVDAWTKTDVSAFASLKAGGEDALNIITEIGTQLNIIKNEDDTITLDNLLDTAEAAQQAVNDLSNAMAYAKDSFGDGAWVDAENGIEVLNNLLSQVSDNPIFSQIYTINIDGKESQASLADLYTELNNLGDNATQDQINAIGQKIQATFTQASTEAQAALQQLRDAAKTLGISQQIESFLKTLQGIPQKTEEIVEESKQNLAKLKTEFETKLTGASTSIKNFTANALALTRITTAVKAVSNAFDTWKRSDVSFVEKLGTSFSALLTSTYALQGAVQLLSNTWIKDTITKAADTVQTWLFKGAEDAATASAIALKVAVGGFVALAAIAIVGIVALVSALSNMESSEEKLYKRTEALNKSIDKNKTAATTLSKDVGNLGSIMDDTTISYTEQLEKVNEIAAAYGVQASAIDGLSNSYGRLKTQMTAAILGESDAQLQQAQANLAEAENIIQATLENRITDTNRYYQLTQDIGGNKAGSYVSNPSEYFSYYQTWTQDFETSYDDWMQQYVEEIVDYTYSSIFEDLDVNRDTSSLFNDEAWTVYYNRSRDNNTSGIRARMGKQGVQSQYLTGEGAAWYDTSWQQELIEHGFDFGNGDFDELINGNGDLDWLYQTLMTDARFSSYASGSGFTGKIASIIGSQGYAGKFTAKEQANSQAALNALYHNPNFELFRSANNEASFTDTINLLLDSMATSGADWDQITTLNSVLSQIEGYKTPSTQVSAALEFTDKLADINGKNTDNAWKQQFFKSLGSDVLTYNNGQATINVDTLIRLNPTAIKLNEDGSIKTISQKAVEAVEAQIAAETAQATYTTRRELESDATKTTIGADEYSALKDSNLFKSEEELTKFVSMSADERAFEWERMLNDDLSAEKTAIEAEVSAMQAYQTETLNNYNNWLEGFAQRAAEAGFTNLGDDDQAAYDRLHSLQAQEERTIATLNRQKTDLIAAISDESKRDEYQTSYGVTVDWEHSADALASVNANLEASETRLGKYNALLQEGIEYQSAYTATTDALTTAQSRQEGLTYWETTGSKIQRANNAISEFTSVMNKSSELTALDFKKIAEYAEMSVEDVINNYNNLSDVEWAKLMYEKAVEQYDKLYDLYDGDVAKQAEVLQLKTAAENSYRDLVKENAQEIAEAQKTKWDEVRSAVTAVNSAIKDLTTGTKEFGDLSFEEIENLRNNLMTVYQDAEKVDNLLKNLGKEDLSGQDKESILAAAKLKTEMLLESAAATEAERSQMYGGLASEMQSRIDSTRQINIEGKETLGGIYELMVTAPNAWNPDTGELKVYNPESGVEYTVLLAEAPQCAGYDPSTGVLTITDGGGMTYRVNIGPGSSATGYDATTGQLTVTAANDVNYKVNIGKGAQAVGYDDTTGIVTLRAGDGLLYSVSLNASTTAKGYDPATGIITLTTAAGTKYELSLEGTSLAKGYDPATGMITLTTATGTTYTFKLSSDADNTGIFNPKTGTYTLQNGSGDVILTTKFSDTNDLKFDPKSGQLVTQTGEQIKLDASLGIEEIKWDEETNTFSFYDATGTVTYTVGGIEGLSKSDTEGWKFDSDAQANVKYTVIEGTAPETGTVEVTDNVTYNVTNPDAEPPADGEAREMEVTVTYKENTIGNIVQTRSALSDAYNARGRTLFEEAANGKKFTDMTQEIVNTYGGDLRAYQVGTGAKTEDISKNIASIGKEVTRQWQKFVDQAGGDIAKAWETASQDEAFMGGYNLFVGLVNGYKIAFGDYGNVFTDTSTDLLLQIMTSLGEHSPSVYTQEMGRYLMEGLSQGFESTEFTGAEGLQERVLNKIKSELDGLTADEQWNTIANALGLTYATDENQMISQMSNKRTVAKVDGKWQIGDQIYDNLSDAYNDFLTEEFSAQKLKEYLSGGYQNDLTLLQQYALNEAMTTALKKYNQNHQTSYKLEDVLNIDPGGFADLVQNELNTSNSKLLATTKTTVAQVKDLWVGVLDSVYNAEQATIQKTVDAWTNAWSAIIKARKTIWEENISLFSALGEAEMKEVIAGWTKAGYSPEQIRAMALATDGSGARAVTAEPYVNSGLQQLGDAAYLNYDQSGRYVKTSFAEWRSNKETQLREMASDEDIIKAFQESVFGDEHISGQQAAQVANILEGQNYNNAAEARQLLRDAGITGSDVALDKIIQGTLLGQQNGGLSYDEATGQWTELDFGAIVNKWLENQMGTAAEQQAAYDEAENTAMYNDINYASQSRASTIEQGSGYLTKQQKDLDILNTVAEGLAEGKTLAEIFEGNDEDLQRFQELMGESTITLESVSDKSMELATAMGDCAAAVQIAAEMIRTGMADSAIINDDGTVTTSKTTKDINGNDVTVNYTLGANGKVINATQTSTDLHTFSANDLEQRDYWAQQGYTVANQDNNTLVASKIVTESLDTNNIDLPEGVETGDSTVDSDVKLTRAQQDEINANYATNAGFGSVQELKEYAQRLQEIGKITKEISEDEAMKFASGLARQEKGFSNAQKNMATYQKTLKTLKTTYKDTYKEATEYTETLEDIRDTYGDVFNLTADQASSLSDTFLESAENAELLEKAIKQDDAAWDQLKANAAKDIVAQVTVDGSQVQTECNNILDTIAAYDFEANGIEVGASINTAPFYDDLNNMVFYSQETADAMSAALSTVGVEGKWEPVTVSVPEDTWTQIQDTGSYDYIDNAGVLHTIPLSSFVEGKEGAHTATIWLFQGAKSKYKGGSSPAPASSSSSGGGGGGGSSKSAKKVEGPKRGADEKERYHEITKKLGEQASILTRLEKIKSRTFGANHLKAINDEIAALEKENDLYAQQAAEASANMDANRTRLEQYGATFNEDGTLNYDEYMDKILENYNAAVEKYNSSDQNAADELALKEAEEIYEEAKKAMEDYEEDMDKLNEAQENMLENQNKISAAMLEGIQYKVELKFDFNDRDIKMMQYFRDKWEELYDMQDESMRYMAEEAIKYEDNLKTLGNAMDKLNAEYANGTLNEADYAAGLQDVNDKIVEQLNNLLTIKQAIKDAYGNTLQQASEELSKHTAVLEHSHSVMEQYIQLQQLMGLGADYSGLSKMYEVQYKSSVMNVQAARDYLDTLQNSKKEIEANIAIYGETDVLKQQLEDVNTAIQEGEDDLLSKTNQALTDAQNMFNNTMQAIVQTFDEQLFRMKNGLANLEDDYAYYQEEQARYLSTSKELYEVSKLNRQINDSIADATTKTSKERLKALQEYINAQADSTRLTEYDVQMMELQYKHALALQELEDARNAKSVVRLTRDENGNFGYQYTADDQNISDAQQKVEDALQQINELAANRVAEIEQAAIQAEREYRDSLLTIAADTTLTLEERQAKMEELTERYAKTMQFNQEQYNNASNALLTNQQYVYERYGVSIMSNTQMTQDQMKTSVGEMINQTTDYATFLQKQMQPGGAIYEALQTYKDNITTVNGVSGLNSWENMVASAADFEAANEAAADALSTINDTLATTLTNIADVTDEWEDHAAALDTVIANYEQLGQTAVDTLRKLAGNLDETEPTATSGAATDEEIESTEKQWMYSWGYGGYSGSWSGYDSRKAAIAGAKSDIYQKIMSTLEAGETDEETASNRSKLQAKIDAALKTIQVTKYKTGGLIDYTGPAWVDGSLSNPELMLNSDDTRNMLRTIQLVRDLDIETLTSLYEAINQTALGMMYSLSGIAAPSGSGTRDVLEQNVQITAEFPNATDRNEIAAAFEDIVNLAAQYANRR